MNSYRFADLRIGMQESFQRIVTEEMMGQFRALSGDENPLHIDADFADRCGFAGPVVYGMCTASLLSALAGMYLPGRFCIIQEVAVKFARPVYVGERLTVTGTVEELNGTVRQAVLKVMITGGNGSKVLRGKMKVGFTDAGA